MKIRTQLGRGLQNKTDICILIACTGRRWRLFGNTLLSRKLREGCGIDKSAAHMHRQSFLSIYIFCSTR